MRANMAKKQNRLRQIIREARESAGITQEQLATKSGISRMTIARIEAGQGASLHSIKDIAFALGLEPAALGALLFS